VKNPAILKTNKTKNKNSYPWDKELAFKKLFIVFTFTHEYTVFGPLPPPLLPPEFVLDLGHFSSTWPASLRHSFLSFPFRERAWYSDPLSWGLKHVWQQASTLTGHLLRDSARPQPRRQLRAAHSRLLWRPWEGAGLPSTPSPPLSRTFRTLQLG
jgi:hypothetical protein